MKSAKTLFLILISGVAYANPLPSNGDVTIAINEAINASTFPEQLDEVTQLVSMMPMSVRGLEYVYKLEVNSADIGGKKNIPRLKDKMKKISIKGLCSNPVMGWYKANFVELKYSYYDKNEDFFFDFRITPNDC